MSLYGKVALITGGVGGLGKAFTRALLKEKISTIYLLDNQIDGKESISEFSQECIWSTVEYVQCDVTDVNAFKGVFNQIIKSHGYIDILINNAGITGSDDDIEGCRKVIQVNLEAVLFGTKLAREVMSKLNGGRGGTIINISSIAGLDPSVLSSMVYAATKSGVVGITRVAGVQEKVEISGVRINAICPSIVDTSLIRQLPFTKEELEDSGVIIIKPEMVAKGLMKLLEDKFITGAVMRITPWHGVDFQKFNRPANPNNWQAMNMYDLDM